MEVKSLSFSSAGLVADGLVLQLVKEHLGKLGPQGWLLDGFPRTLPQAEALDVLLEELGQPLDFVFFLDVSEETILQRLRDRWVHPGSGRVYSHGYQPPRIPGKDDITGEPLLRRVDDDPATVPRRLQTFHRSVAPLLHHYRSQGTLHSIDAPSSDIAYKSIFKILSEASR